MTKILFLLASPDDRAPLHLQEEMTLIQECLRTSPWGGSYAFEVQQHVAPKQLQGLLLKHKPDVVHFSGHGNERGEIILVDDQRNSHPVPNKSLATMFNVLHDKIVCVLLNACYSAPQAREIAKAVPVVIGMESEVSSQAASAFSSAFYHALGFDKSVQDAFDLGRTQVHLLGGSEHSTPQMHTRKGVHARSIHICARPRLCAEFIMDEGRPARDDDSYGLRIFVRNAPQLISTVVYQFHDDTIEDQFEEVTTSADNFATTRWLYGDVEIRVMLWGAGEGCGFTQLLSDALERHYGPKPPSRIAATIRKIRNE